MSDLPRPDELRRFVLYGATADDASGESLAVGAELPSGHVLATVDVAAPPAVFGDMADLRGTLDLLADGPGGDVWIEYEDPAP